MATETTVISQNTRTLSVGRTSEPDTTAKLQKTKQPHAIGPAKNFGNHAYIQLIISLN